MRLLNTRTQQMKEFFDSNVPAYAILSHTWGDEEVLFQDIQFLDNVKEKAGFAKIRHCCDQALQNGVDWVWVDTCCIDKSSSAELSEAINSMYQYYQKAELCLAYLSDVPKDADLQSADGAFARSRWFTRGWTLQELIAPNCMVFYDCEWTAIGTKHRLCTILSDITGVDTSILKGQSLRIVSVAKRMSWASRRETTRKEDEAYCLMGIFGINMPLLYGEGEKAFVRLQEEIMKDSEDQSLFSWRVASDQGPFPPRRGLLARSPGEFTLSGDVVPFRILDSPEPYSMTNRGLRITMPLLHTSIISMYTALLGCRDEGQLDFVLAIPIRAISEGGDQFCREYPNQVQRIPLNSLFGVSIKTLYMTENVSPFHDYVEKDVFRIRTSFRPSVPTYEISGWFPHDSWDRINAKLRFSRSGGSDGVRAGLLFTAITCESFVLVLGLNESKNNGVFLPQLQSWCAILHINGLEALGDVVSRCEPTWKRNYKNELNIRNIPYERRRAVASVNMTEGHIAHRLVITADLTVETLD